MFWIRPCGLRYGLKKEKLRENLERKPRQRDKCLDSLKSEAGGSRITAGTNTVVRVQGNQARSVTQPADNTGRSGAPYCQTCGYSHNRRCGRPGACFRCGQSGHMKRNYPLNVSRPTYGTTAPSSIVAPAHTIGLVAQPMGRETSSRDAQSGMRG